MSLNTAILKHTPIANFVVCSLLFVICPNAAAQDAKQPLFFISPIAVTVHSRNSLSIGGGVAIGGGDGVTMGVRAVYFADREAVHSLEICAFMRFFLFGSNAVYGPFLQLNTGAVIFARNEALTVPASAGTYSAFLSAGWRFLLGNRFYIEPAVRAGTPYFIGAEASAGFRF